MYKVLNGVYNDYLSWEAINKGVDHLVDCVEATGSSSSSTEELNPQQKSALKSAFLWFSTSTIGIVTLGFSAVSAPVRYALGGVAMIPLIPPLVSSLRLRIYSCTKEISCKTAVKVTAVFSFFCAVHGEFAYLMSQKMESKSVVLLSFALSNFTMNGFAYILNFILSNNDKEKKEALDVDEKKFLKQSEKLAEIFNLKPSIEEIKRNIRIVRNKIQITDDFVNAHPDLQHICMEEIQTHPFFEDNGEPILNPPLPTKEPESLDDSIVEIHYRRDLKIELNHLEYTFNQRKELFARSRRVRLWFDKYFSTQTNDVQNNFSQLSIYNLK